MASYLRCTFYFQDRMVTISRHIKTRLDRSHGWTLLLAVCFGAMTLLGSPLHLHDLDPLHLDPDCVPCHLSHSSLSLESALPNLDIPLRVTEWVSASATVWFIPAPLAASSRSPPVFR